MEDTAAEAAALRRQGVTVLCVLQAGTGELPAARMIYGRDMVRVPAVGWFADTVGKADSKAVLRSCSGQENWVEAKGFHQF